MGKQLEPPPGGTERLESLWIGSHSLEGGPLCDLCLLPLDLDSHRGNLGRCDRPRFRDLRRCLLRDVCDRYRIGDRGRDYFGVTTTIEIYPGWCHPV
jgi:hypothetical protein